jgi:magnesium-transporting ATPase (P-type)
VHCCGCTACSRSCAVIGPHSTAYDHERKSSDDSSIDIQVLATLEFTSNRRRQSVIIKDGQRYLLLMKGADVAVFGRLAADQDQARAVQEAFLDSWSQQV